MTASDIPLRKDAYFASIPEWVLYHEDLSPQAIRLYGVLDRYAEGRCFPSRKRLANQLGVKSVDTVDRALRELQDAGAVSVTPRFDEAGDPTSSLYTVHFLPALGVAAHSGGGGRTDAATSPQESGDGGRTDAARGGRTDAALTRATLNQSESTRGSSSGAADASPDADPREDVDRLCTHLANRIEGNGSKRPTITKRWRDAARLLMDRDGRTETQVHRAIDWCQDDEFWRTNILSMPKLREQYDRLRLAAERSRTTPTARQAGIDWDAAAARAAERDRTTLPPTRSLP